EVPNDDRSSATGFLPRFTHAPPSLGWQKTSKAQVRGQLGPRPRTCFGHFRNVTNRSPSETTPQTPTKNWAKRPPPGGVGQWGALRAINKTMIMRHTAVDGSRPNPSRYGATGDHQPDGPCPSCLGDRR